MGRVLLTPRNLVEVYRSQGRYGEAEPLYVQALEIRKAELGDRHPSTALSLNNLAALYFNTNRLPEAAAAMSAALSIFEERLGSTHPNTLTVRSNLEGIQQAIESLTQPDSILRRNS
ncbi:MAG: tetratricopeptide repeat protein [Phormidesmis sp.]